MARVYVSSTSYDLKDCREQVCETLRRMRHEDVAMEHYVAEDVRAVVKCLNDVANCDLYICIMAWRYGHIPEGYEHSITELEYRRAVETGKTCLTFVLAEDADWKMSLVEMGAMDRVKAFREELRRDRISRTFTSPQDLARQVAEAVHEWERQQGITTAGGRTNWEAYRGAVIAKHHLVPMETLTGPEQDRGVQIPLTKVFVTQQTSAQAIDTAEAGAAELREPSLHVIGRDAKQVILGEAGSGKSTLLRYTMLALCGSESEPETTSPVGLRDRPLPFLIELRQYAREKSGGQVQDFIDYLVTRAKEFYGSTIESQDLRALFQEDGQALVLFDGLDEILHEGERVKIADQLDAFARQYPGARIVATSRIAGYNPERLQGYGFSHYTLRQFGLTEIREFLSRWYATDAGHEPERHAAELTDRIAKNPRLRELAGNPLLLTMMAVINRHEELPERRWKLYERCTAVLLEHWDVKRKNIARHEGFPLTVDQKERILRRVSMHMLRQSQRDGRLNAIPRRTLMRILSGYLMETFDKSRGEAELNATEILNHLCERSYILTEIGEDTFGFVHRTFMEYFAATDLMAEFSRRKANYEWLKDLYGTNWQQDEWQEVLLLLIAMLAAEEFPIEDVVDNLLGLDSRPLSWNIVFAARCIAEVGTAGELSQVILDRLGSVILRYARGSPGHGAKLDGGFPWDGTMLQFFDDALVAFSRLALVGQPSELLVREIDEWEGKSGRVRFVAWQMKLALQPREERRAFAIQALTDEAEMVRLGAINALEREWPGREDVGPRLLKALRIDRSARVRQVAIQALRRSWPDQREILEAIADRAGDEYESTHVRWLIRYISSEWRHGHFAMDVVLQLAAVRPRPSTPKTTFGIAVAAADGILDGWGDRPGIATWLRDRHACEADPQVRDAIVMAVARGGVDEEWALAWLQLYAVQGAEWRVRCIALEAIEREWRNDHQVRIWLGSRAVDDPDAEVRLHAMALAGGNYESLLWHRLESPIQKGFGVTWWPWEVATQWRGHPEIISLFEERAVNDASPVIRRAALGGVYAYRSSSTTAIDFLYSRLAQESDRDTRAMILLILTEGASGGTALPRGLAVTLGLIDSKVHQADRPFASFARPHSSGDDQLRATLTSVAEDDNDWELRTAAAQAIAALWGDRPEVSEWLAERIRKGTSKSARALLKSFRTR